MTPAVHSIEVWLLALTITIGVLAGFGIFARWCSFSPAVPQKKIDQLRVGMKPDEIVSLLGPPRETKKSAEGHRLWVYGARVKRHVLLIEFDTHDALESFAHGVPGAHRNHRTDENP
jgi:outer membrane protein assembly factor BamE (lipoprotein component of BamABCDE complex)